MEFQSSHQRIEIAKRDILPIIDGKGSLAKIGTSNNMFLVIIPRENEGI